MVPPIRALLSTAAATLAILTALPADAAPEATGNLEAFEAEVREQLRRDLRTQASTPKTHHARQQQRLPPGSTLSVVSGTGQVLLPGEPSAPLVVRLTGPEGDPLPEVPVVWEILVPNLEDLEPGQVPVPKDVEEVIEGPLQAVVLARGEPTTTNGSGVTSNQVTILVPIPARIQARVAGTSLTAVFDLSAALQELSGVDPNTRSVAGAIDVACPALLELAVLEQASARQGDLLLQCSNMVFAAANPEANDAVRRALDEVTTEEIAAGGTLAIEVPADQMANVRSRLSALRAGVRGVSVRGLSLNLGSGTFLGDWVQPLFDTALARAQQAGDDPLLGPEIGRLGLFLNGQVTVGEKDATALEDGFDFDSYGLTGGVDYRVRDTTVLGIAGGYTLSESEFTGDQGSLDVEGYSLSTYLTAYSKEGGGYLDAVVTYGESSYELDRRISYTLPHFLAGADPGIPAEVTVDQVATGEPDGDQLSASLELGWDFSRGGFTFAPFLRGTHADVSIDAYQESMSDPGGPGNGLALSVDEQEYESLVGVLGTDLTWAISRSWGVFVPQLRGEWHREFEDDAEAITARFLFDPKSTAFVVTTDEQDQEFFNAGVGFSAVLGGGVNAFVFYDTLLGLDDFESHTLSFGVRIER